MKTIAYYHVLLINNWKEIVTEQLTLMKRSGLYDAVDQVKIGALGGDVRELETHTKDYLKVNVSYHSANVKEYEFATLDMLHYDSQNEKPFYGVYFHTKAVSFPGNEGGKYWRDYMNEYILTQWKENVKKLQKGYDLCGVKLLTEQDKPAYKLHYSGNFFWFKSSYVKTLRKELSRRDRYLAEFWIGSGNPKTATLCQMFVDYNTKGIFEIKKKNQGINYVHTLAFNLPTEVEKATASLYRLNNTSDFKHYIIDLSFPLVDPDGIPGNIEKAKNINSEKLKDICRKYGSTYVKMPNIGVSQNWEQVYRHLKLKPKDVLIGADPDERPQQKDWVYAMGEVCRQEKIGLVSLMMLDHESIIAKLNKTEFNTSGIRYYSFSEFINWALIGMSGEWLDKMGGVPYPKNAERYGWIEHEMIPLFKKYGYKWVVLPDYKVKHTDYELGEPGSSKILREWKNYIIFKLNERGYQISLEEFLNEKIKGLIK